MEIRLINSPLQANARKLAVNKLILIKAFLYAELFVKFVKF